MTLRSSDLQLDSDLDSIRNSCDVYKDKQSAKGKLGLQGKPQSLNLLAPAAY